MNIILTPREKEIFHLLVKNYSTKDIARKLNISEKTVRNIKQNLFWAFFYNVLIKCNSKIRCKIAYTSSI